jgi:hypothetical protein
MERTCKGIDREVPFSVLSSKQKLEKYAETLLARELSVLCSYSFEEPHDRSDLNRELSRAHAKVTLPCTTRPPESTNQTRRQDKEEGTFFFS